MLRVPLAVAMVAVMGTSTEPRKRALAMTFMGSCDSFCSCLAPRVPPTSHTSNSSSEAALTSLEKREELGMLVGKARSL